MTLDVQHGNMAEAEAERLWNAIDDPDDHGHEPGSTEPWVSALVAGFIVARGARTVLETGCFKGATSVWVYDALRRLGGGHLHLCEIETERLLAAGQRVYENRSKDPWVDVTLHGGDVLDFLRSTPARFDVAWVDDCHEKPHVTKELQLLYPKMNPGGLILLHDVFGVCDLRTVVQQFGGYSIDLPRLGPAGGLGIIQV